MLSADSRTDGICACIEKVQILECISLAPPEGRSIEGALLLFLRSLLYVHVNMNRAMEKTESNSQTPEYPSAPNSEDKNDRGSVNREEKFSFLSICGIAVTTGESWIVSHIIRLHTTFVIYPLILFNHKGPRQQPCMFTNVSPTRETPC